MTPLASLAGARIRRIDAPSPDLWALTLAAGQTRGTLLISLSPAAAGVGWVERRPHGQVPSGFVQKLRKELEGGRVQRFGEQQTRIELQISRAGQPLRLVFDFVTQNIIAYAGEVVLASARQLRPDEGSSAATPATSYWPADLETLAARGAALLESRGEALFAARRGVLAKAVAGARQRLKRRLQAVADDAARAQQAPALRERGRHVLAHLHAIARGATRVQVLDYAVDPPAAVEIVLDPARSPREQAEAWFKQARRFERGAALAARRTAASAAELAELDALAEAIGACSDPAALDQLAARAETIGLRAELPSQIAAPEKHRGPSRHVPYRTLRGSGGRTILVGKGAADNDTLTREHARPQDLWLHARDRSGAHVVVPLERGETCPAELLVDAAILAAHFSDARGEPIVDVSHTGRRYVRKPKGSPIGTVLLEREKVLRVHLDSDRLAALLKTQRD